jgi:hypothetical protein
MPSQDRGNQLQFKTYDPFENYERVEELWKTMLAKSQHSYFTSWGWISTWIKSLPVESGVKLSVGYRNDKPVLAFFMGNRRYRKYGLLPSHILSLNSTGNPHYDCLYIEYNSMLSDTTAGPLIQELSDYLGTLVWDEFILPGMSPGGLQDVEAINTVSPERFQVLSDTVSDSYYVDLEKIRAAGMDFMKLLSANKRSQIRRSIKQYELDGKVEAEEARGMDEALVMFDEMVAMHQAEWNRRGEPGVFSSRYLVQFHRELIRSRFDHHEIQLLKVRNNLKTIGYLYSFVYRGDVLFYQSGFSYNTENVYRPGLVSHYYAILHNTVKGMKTYDFLAGEADYKRSLSTNIVKMYWMRWIKSPRRYRIEKNLLALKNHVKSMPGLAKKVKRIRNWIRSARG